jgi:crotonobetainyl-CoA:carnitine CoA-transferase CaiB-like acyl-CoA transferase
MKATRSGALTAQTVVGDLWRDAGLDAAALQRLDLEGVEPALPSSFAVGTAAQSAIAAAALAASEIGALRGGVARRVAVEIRAAAMECSSFFSIDGRTPPKWDKISGLYRCRGGWARIHANFAHHRDGALRLLGLPPGAGTPRAAVEGAMAERDAFEFEAAAAAAGLVVAAVRTFGEWDAHPQGRAVVSLPLLTWEKIGDAPPRALPPLDGAALPLAGIRVLDLTRILAGPVGGRSLAAYGADVMLVNSPHLPNIDSIIETSRGKLSVHIDLATAQGRDTLRALLADAHVFHQGYRPGGIAAHGFSPAEAAASRPGLVYVSLSAYGHAGPWCGRRGFDSLVQSATGFNDAEMRAAGSAQPKPMPVQILDYASGFLMAFAAQAGLLRQAREGGSWHVRVALARTAQWVRSLGRVENGFAVPMPAPDAWLETGDSGWGRLVALRHGARLSGLPQGWARPSVRPGTNAPAWPA